MWILKIYFKFLGKLESTYLHLIQQNGKRLANFLKKPTKMQEIDQLTAKNQANGLESSERQRPPLQDIGFRDLFNLMPAFVQQTLKDAIETADVRQKNAEQGRELLRIKLNYFRKHNTPLYKLTAQFADVLRRFLPVRGVGAVKDWPSLDETQAYWDTWMRPFEAAICGDDEVVLLRQPIEQAA